MGMSLINPLGLEKGGKLCSWEDRGGELGKPHCFVLLSAYSKNPEEDPPLAPQDPSPSFGVSLTLLVIFLIFTIEFVSRSNFWEVRFIFAYGLRGKQRLGSPAGTPHLGRLGRRD